MKTDKAFAKISEKTDEKSKAKKMPENGAASVHISRKPSYPNAERLHSTSSEIQSKRHSQNGKEGQQITKTNTP